MSWFKKKDKQNYSEAQNYIEMKHWHCDKKDCINYNEITIIYLKNREVLLYSKSINLFCCLVCEHLKKIDNYRKYN